MQHSVSVPLQKTSQAFLLQCGTAFSWTEPASVRDECLQEPSTKSNTDPAGPNPAEPIITEHFLGCQSRKNNCTPKVTMTEWGFEPRVPRTQSDTLSATCPLLLLLCPPKPASTQRIRSCQKAYSSPVWLQALPRPQLRPCLFFIYQTLENHHNLDSWFF